MKFEKAIEWLAEGLKVRRACWARMPDYTRTTPPLHQDKVWRIWRVNEGEGGIAQGWGGQIGMQLAPDDLVRDGTIYEPSDDDRIADDWETL